MTINILADAAGLRATDLTAAAPTIAITAAGPAVLRNITRIKAKVDILGAQTSTNKTNLLLRKKAIPSLIAVRCLSLLIIPFRKRIKKGS